MDNEQRVNTNNGYTGENHGSSENYGRNDTASSGSNAGGYSQGGYNSSNNNGNNSGYNGNYGYNGTGNNGNNYYNNNYNGYDNGNYNGNGGNGGNGNKKWMKILAAACGVVIVVSMIGGVGYTIKGVLSQVTKEVDNDDVAWKDKDDSDRADTAEDKKDKDIATTQPISVAQNSGSAAGVSDVSGIVEEVMPSVVSIISTTSVKGYSIFGQQYEQEVNAGGTGFIVGQNDKELLIATNNHVVENSTAIQITFNDETTAEAVLKGGDADADLAVVSVKLDDIDSDTMGKIKVAVLGDSDKVKVGQMAIVIGNAKGMGQSVTVGYVSAKDRELDIQDENTGKVRKMHYLQTDAAINGGNSGGPLLDVNGNVVGISSAKISDTQIEGMCYAIPISNAIPIINELMNRETLSDDEKGYMGVSLADVSSDAVKMYSVPNGAYVKKVYKKSPADNAGLKEGDIITKIDGVEVSSSEAASSKITSCRAGTEITVTLCRQNAAGRGYDEMEVKVTLTNEKEAGIKEDEKSDKSESAPKEEEEQKGGNGFGGMDGFGDIFGW